MKQISNFDHQKLYSKRKKEKKSLILFARTSLLYFRKLFVGDLICSYFFYNLTTYVMQHIKWGTLWFRAFSDIDENIQKIINN